MRASLDIDWADFLGRYRPLALRIARGLAPNAADAEELVDEAVRAVYEAGSSPPGFETTEHARNVFLRTLRNLAVSRLRAVGRAPRRAPVGALEPPAPAPGPLDALAAREWRGFQRERLARALEALPPAEREALVLRYLEGLSYKQLAQRAGRPLSTVHARVEAALRKIRARIGNDEDGA